MRKGLRERPKPENVALAVKESLLREAVASRKNVLVAGRTGTGKRASKGKKLSHAENAAVTLKALARKQPWPRAWADENCPL